MQIGVMPAFGRTSGILLPLFSFRSATDFGIGDFGAVEASFAWMNAARQRVLMLLPLLPTLPIDSSPYATRSAFGLNPLFIDLSRVPCFSESGGIESLSASDRERLTVARQSARVRYDLVVPLKNSVLRSTFKRFDALHWRPQTPLAKQFLDYCQREAWWLSDFSLFAAISESQGHRAWWQWPEALRSREPSALESERARLSDSVLFERWKQWIAESQWQQVRQQAKNRGILLCGDEPFIVGQDSADAWANPQLLRLDARLGVPPDEFSATGQDWGLPYFDFEAMQADGFRWLRARASKNAAYFDLRRVDHAVGYFRQWIRDAQTPTGRFVPPEETRQRALGRQLFQLLSEPAGIVAEDLGVIPDFVRKTLTELSIPGYRVLRWEKDDSVYRNPHQFPALSMVTTGSHDTETLREWWESRRSEDRRAVKQAYPELRDLEIDLEFPGAIHRALLSAAENAGSSICILPWQDVLGTRDRINLPGSKADSNWAYRMESAGEELLSRGETGTAARLLAQLTEAAGR